MAGEEAAEGSRSRRRTDLNLYLGLPPLPQPPDRLDAALDCLALMPNASGPAPGAPRADEPEELLTPAVAYSPSNALSTPEEQLMLDSIVYAWLNGHSTDGEDGTDAVDPAMVLGAPVGGANVSPPLAAGLGGDDLPPWVERFVQPGRVGVGVEMVSATSILSRSSHGAVGIEARTPELRFQRLIQISQHHSIVRSGTENRGQRAGNPEADRLVWAIQRSHNSLDSARRQKLDGDDKVGGKGAGKKDGCCGCNSSFECNICLDAAKEPVVTPCGHLFCWPCLYQWLHAHSAHSECPVCKGEVLEVNVTPIYGRGDGDRQLIENQGIVRGQTNPAVGVEVPVVPASRARARARRQQRQDSLSAIMLNMGNVAPESSNQNPMLPSNADSNATVVPAAPQQSSSVDQASTSSTTSVIVGEPGSSRRSRPSDSPTTRRTRRRQQVVP